MAGLESKLSQQVECSEEQRSYANVIRYGSYIGMLVLLICFIIYLTGILDPHVPIDKLSEYWTMSSGEYLEKAGLPHGWGWVTFINHGDILNFVGIAILAGLTIVAYVTMIPRLFKCGDKLVGVIAIAEVLVLLLAASGILQSGGH